MAALMYSSGETRLEISCTSYTMYREKRAAPPTCEKAWGGARWREMA